MPTGIIVVFVAAFGLVVGSFLNVVIYRLPRGLSTVFPGSRCPSCGAAIQPWQNVPVLSYLLLRGRCRECHAPISWRYPFVEALTAALFVLCWGRFGVSPAAVVAAVFCGVLVALAGIDLDHLLLPDRITIPVAVLGLLLHAVVPRWLPWSSLGAAVAGAVFGGGLLLLLNGAWYLLRRVEGLGLGDAKMLAMIGAVLGWHGVLVTLILAVFSAATVALVLMGRRRLGAQHKIPFGPFLSAGGVVALLAGEQLSRWYLGSFYWPS